MKLAMWTTAAASAIVAAAACDGGGGDGAPRTFNEPPGSGVHEGGADTPPDPAHPTDGGADGGVVKGVSLLAVGSGAGATGDGDHTCVVIGTDRALYCWGANDRGQLGNGKTGIVDFNGFAEDLSTPYHVATDETGQLFSGITDLSLSAWHSCATKGDALYCWGQRLTGAQAEPPGASNADRTKPRAIAGLSVKMVAAGGPHTCALRTAGGIACFGHSTFNELGRPNPDDLACTAGFFLAYAGSTTHVCSGDATDMSTQLTNVRALVAGQVHSCALVVDKVVCWGSNNGGRLGDPMAGNAELSPQTVVTDPGLRTPLDGVSAIASGGGSHTCALRNGQVYCWGLNDFGQLGVPTATLAQRPYAAAVASIDAVTAIGAAEGLTCAARPDGVWCWGNTFGPGGTRVPSAKPLPVKGPAGAAALTNVTSLAVGKNHVCALRSDATVWCWGLNARGQLGDGTNTASDVPVQPKGLPQ